MHSLIKSIDCLKKSGVSAFVFLSFYAKVQMFEMLKAFLHFFKFIEKKQLGL